MSIKIERARKLSLTGNYPASFGAMLAAIPASIVDALTSRQLAELIDANWTLAQASKAIANREALAEGAVWDARAQAFRSLEHHAA